MFAMKYLLLILVSNIIPCFFSFPKVGIQIKEEPNPPQTTASVEPAKARSLEPKQDSVFDHPALSVPIQVKPEAKEPVELPTKFRIHIHQNNSYHDIEVPISAEADRKQLHDLIFENSKQGMLSQPKCDKTEGKNCQDHKRFNDVDLSEEPGSRNKMVQNFKGPLITVPRGSEIFPHHHSGSGTVISSGVANESSIPLPEHKSISVNTPTPSTTQFMPDEEFPYDKAEKFHTTTPAVEFPYNNSIPADKFPNPFYHPTTSNEMTTPNPTNNQSNADDESDAYVVLELVVAVIFFGSFCSILYYFYAGSIRSCNRRQILIEEDEEEGIRMEMNPRNTEEEENDEGNEGETDAMAVAPL
ncbi:uncharacterized protein LOC111045784 [Nilaparvata lugens]|uniref:uncharacterized protein LOC111045784 n=1 Tax=Nilaparvata lugens TaxID=108931 RepID=UPI00193D441E|nr:uncharacterized protein LOC111045784 [Nilaparvata lugens]